MNVKDMLDASNALKPDMYDVRRAIRRKVYRNKSDHVFLGNSDNFCYDSSDRVYAENDLPDRFQPGLDIYHRIALSYR